MRANFFFYATLLIIGTIASSSISPSELDTQLLEFSKHPSSDAIFATMSMQLTGNGGFNRVLALLNELVHDGKAQLHDMNMVFRAVDARCHVSARHYEMSGEFFTNTLTAAKAISNNSMERLHQTKEMASNNARSNAGYAGLLKRVLKESGKDIMYLKRIIKIMAQALKNATGAAEAIKNWDGKSAALIQTKMSAMKAGFVQIHKYDLAEPTMLLEGASRNDKMKARLLQWVVNLRTKFDSALRGMTGYLRSRTHAFTLTRSQIMNLMNNLKASAGSLAKSVVWCMQQIKHANALVKLNHKLLSQNAGLQKANVSFCASERKNYHINQVKVHQEIKLFIEIRAYFIDHYSKINSFIKAKYHH